MTQKIFKVLIGGLEYKLTSDDEQSLRKAVDMVNAELELVQGQIDIKLPLTQLYVLVSLNLAEKLIKQNDNSGSENENLLAEVRKLNELLENIDS
ncbi:hypothetical protein MASR1M45_09660 [Candidatus Kapaibacterium sp.]